MVRIEHSRYYGLPSRIENTVANHHRLAIVVVRLKL